MPSSAHIADWQGSLQYGKEGTYGTLATTRNTIGVIGTPTLDVGPAFIDTGVTGSGTSERLAAEFATGKKQASFAYDCRMGETTFFSVMRSIAQSLGTKTGVGPYTFKWNPWTDQPGTNIGTSLQAIMRSTEANGTIELLGAIAESLKLESSDSFIKQSQKWRGITVTSPFPTVTASGTTWVDSLQHMYFNHVLSINSGANANPSKQSIEVINNLGPYYGTSQTPSDLMLMRFGIKGSFSIPYKTTGAAEYQAFMAKTNRRFTFKYGTAGTAGYVEFDFDGYYDDAKIVEENGLKMVDCAVTSAKNSTTTTITVITTLDASAFAY